MTHTPLPAGPQAAPWAAASALAGGGGDRAVLCDETLRLWRAFSDLPMEQRRWALTRGDIEQGAAGARVEMADEVVVVVSGALGTCVGETSICADILGPGAVVATGAGRAVAAEWIADGRLYRTSRSDWAQTAGVAGLDYLLEAADRGRERLERGVACASRHLATERVADLLVALQASTGLSALPLSQERLGAMLGLRRTTVNASCRTLQSRGLMRTVRGHVRLGDLAGLRGAACGCRTALAAPRPSTRA